MINLYGDTETRYGSVVGVDTNQKEAVIMELFAKDRAGLLSLKPQQVGELIGQLSRWVEEQPERIEAH